MKRILDFPRKLLWAFFSGFWRVLSWLRQTIANLLLLLIIVAVFVGLNSQQQSQPDMPEESALLIAPKGSIVEQLRFVDPFERLLAASVEEPEEILLRDLLKAIASAKDDRHITAIVLELDELVGTGITTIQEVGAALQDFKQSGKPVIAIGDYYSQNQYLLASYADEIYLHPMGEVSLQGYGQYRTYYKSALDKLKIDYHVFRVGEFKSAMEPYMRDDMSPQAKQANLLWLDAVWGVYQQTVSQQREISLDALNQYVDQRDVLLAEKMGDGAQVALSVKLVDGLKTRPEMDDYLGDVLGVDEDGHFERVALTHYIQKQKPLIPVKNLRANKVAVVVASGEILDGYHPPGTIGGDSLADTLYRARTDKQVKALVLRVNSPGGSMFASEVIREELALLQQAGKPLVVSMAGMAASGGYWISANADQIWAAPTTLTGSIGVYGAFPSVSRALSSLGLNSDGVGTTRMADAYRVDRPLSDYVAGITQQQVEHAYRSFISLVGEGREMSAEQVDSIAQGRVWTGQQAMDKGLVDQLGSLADAVASAAQMAELDDYKVDYFERELTPKEQFLQQLSTVKVVLPISSSAKLLQSWIAPLAEDMLFFDRMNDPKGLYSYCVACSTN